MRTTSVTARQWEAQLTDHVVDTVAYYRDQRGHTTQWLADECTRLGLPITRTALAAMLTQHVRKSVTLQEIIIFARALNVPPVYLAFPVHLGAKVEVLPGVEVDAYVAADWFGDRPDSPQLPIELGERYASDRFALEPYARYFAAAARFERYNALLADESNRLAIQVENSGKQPTSDQKRNILQLSTETRSALRIMRGAVDEMEAAEIGVPSLPPGLDEKRWEDTDLPVIPAIERSSGQPAKYPMAYLMPDKKWAIVRGPA